VVVVPAGAVERAVPVHPHVLDHRHEQPPVGQHAHPPREHDVRGHPAHVDRVRDERVDEAHRVVAGEALLNELVEEGAVGDLDQLLADAQDGRAARRHRADDAPHHGHVRHERAQRLLDGGLLGGVEWGEGERGGA
jgi:hypothetical protein